MPGEMQGKSLRANLAGHTPGNWRKAMYYRYWMHNDADHHVPGHYGIRTERYKLIYYYGKALGMKGAQEPDTKPDWEFFDMAKDPREMRNLYREPGQQKRIAAMKKELERLQGELGDRAD